MRAERYLSVFISCVDSFQQASEDPNVPIEDVAGAVKELIQASKVKHWRACRSFAARMQCSL